MEKDRTWIITTNSQSASIIVSNLDKAGIAYCFAEEALDCNSTPASVNIWVFNIFIEKIQEVFRNIGLSDNEWRWERAEVTDPILLLTDSLNLSDNLYSSALQYASLLKSQIIILYVHFSPIIDIVPAADNIQVPLLPQPILQETIVGAKNAFARFASELGKHVMENKYGLVRIWYCFREAYTDQQILEIAQNYSPQILVAGFRRKPSFQNGFLAAAIRKFPRKITTPFLVVPESETVDFKADLTSIACFFEPGIDPLSGIQSLMKTAGRFTKRLIYVEVTDAHSGISTEVSASAAAMVEDYFKGHWPKVEIQSFSISRSLPGNVLSEFFQTNNVGLLAVCKSCSGWFSKIFKKELHMRLIESIRMPVLIFQ